MADLSSAGEAFTDLILEVFRVNGLLLEVGNQLTQPVGLSSARWQVLGVVEHSPVPVSNVARLMGLTRQSVQQTADALEREGFITYTNNPHHRRARLMVITPRGRQALDYVQERQANWANHIGGKHEVEKLRTVAKVLRELRDSLEQPTPAEGVKG